MDRMSLTFSAKHHEISLPFTDRDDVGAFLIIQLHGKTQEELDETYEKAGELCLAKWGPGCLCRREPTRFGEISGRSGRNTAQGLDSLRKWFTPIREM